MMCRTTTPPISPDVLDALEDARAAIIRGTRNRLRCNTRDLAHWNDQTAYGIAEATDLILRSLIGALHLQDPAVLDDQVLGINNFLGDHHVAPSSLLECLQNLAETIDTVLPSASSAAVHPYLQRMIVQQRAQVGSAPRASGREQGAPTRTSADLQRSWLV